MMFGAKSSCRFLVQLRAKRVVIPLRQNHWAIKPTHTREGHSLDFGKRVDYNSRLDRYAKSQNVAGVISTLRDMEKDGTLFIS